MRDYKYYERLYNLKWELYIFFENVGEKLLQFICLTFSAPALLVEWCCQQLGHFFKCVTEKLLIRNGFNPKKVHRILDKNMPRWVSILNSFNDKKCHRMLFTKDEYPWREGLLPIGFWEKWSNRDKAYWKHFKAECENYLLMEYNIPNWSRMLLTTPEDWQYAIEKFGLREVDCNVNSVGLILYQGM